MSLYSSFTSFFTPTQQFTAKDKASFVDIILYACNLASDSQAVSIYRERLREITAEFQPEAKELSEEDRKELISLYGDIENYLLEKETLKKITKTELRKKIEEKFDIQSATISPFWNQSA